MSSADAHPASSPSTPMDRIFAEWTALATLFEPEPLPELSDEGVFLVRDGFALGTLKLPSSTTELNRRIHDLLAAIRAWAWPRILHRMKEKEGAEEVMQEVLIACTRHLRRVHFLDARGVRSWLNRVAVHRCLDAHRRERRYRHGVLRPELHRKEKEGGVLLGAGVEIPCSLDLDAAWECLKRAQAAICEVVARGRSEPGWARVASDEVGASEAEVRRNLEVLFRTRIHGDDGLAVGRSLGYSGSNRQAQNRVARQAARGALALAHGALLILPHSPASEQVFLMALRTWLTPISVQRPSTAKMGRQGGRRRRRFGAGDLGV